MKAAWILLLPLILCLSACKTPEERAREKGQGPAAQESEAPKEQSEAPATEAPKPASPTEAPKEAPEPKPAEKPKGQTAPILLRTLIHSINPVKDGDRARFQVIFNVAEVVRGSFPSKQAVINVAGMRASFPWIIDDEFEGGEVFIHVKNRRGKPKVLGFSGTVSGAITPYR